MSVRGRILIVPNFVVITKWLKLFPSRSVYPMNAAFLEQLVGLKSPSSSNRAQTAALLLDSNIFFKSLCVCEGAEVLWDLTGHPKGLQVAACTACSAPLPPKQKHILHNHQRIQAMRVVYTSRS